MMAVRRIEAAVLALGVLGAAWLASDRILWPFIAAGIVVGVALMAAYRFVWYKPSGQPNRYRNLALLIGAAGGPILSASLQAALGRNVVLGPAMFVAGFFVGGLVVAAIRPWAGGQPRRVR